MRQWLKNAHQTIREATDLATRTSDARLHMACVRSIEAMIADDLVVPSDLRTYARQTRALYGDQCIQQCSAVAPQMAG